MQHTLILPLILLAAVPFVMVLGNSMLIPVFPQIETELDLSQVQVGLLITAFSIPAGLVIPFAGALSDHIGRKRILFPALLLYGAGGLISGTAALLLANPYTWVLIGRIVQGVGAGGTYQIALALSADLISGRERTKAVGLLEAANGLGKMISPVAGAALDIIIWYAPFFGYGALAVPLAFALWFLVPEENRSGKQQSAKQYLSALGTIFRTKGVPLLACYFAGASGLFLLFGLLSLISDELELRYAATGIIKGLYLAIPVTVMTVLAYVSGLILQDRPGWLAPAIICGLGLSAAGLTGLAFLTSLPALLGFASVMGLGIGLMLPALNTLITGSTETDERGLITALYGTVRFFGVALGPPTVGLLQEAGRLPTFLSGAAVAALALVLAALFVRPRTVLATAEEATQLHRAHRSECAGEARARPWRCECGYDPF